MARIKIYQEEKVPGPLQELWRLLKANHIALVGLGCFSFLVLLTLFAPILSPYSPVEQHADALLLPPAWDDAGDSRFLLGTDDLGRDMLSRLMHGTTLTFGMSLLVVAAAMPIGVAIGAFAGLTKGVKSSILNHILDTVMSIPSLLLAIIIVAILGPGINNTLWAIGVVLIPQFIHAVRNAVREELKKDYVVASRLDGANNVQVLRYSVFPNIVDVIVVQTTLAFSVAILDIAALGFLNLGAQQPSPEWGAMLSGGLEFIYNASWNVTLPGFAIFFAVLSTNLVGDGLRAALRDRISH